MTAGSAVRAVDTTSFWRRLIRTAVAGLAASDPQAAALLACLAAKDVSPAAVSAVDAGPSGPSRSATTSERTSSVVGSATSSCTR